MQGQASMLLCAKARFLTSSQMKGLSSSESMLMSLHTHIKLSNTSEVSRLLMGIESLGTCSTREAFSLLRSLTRRH